jgi:hypothetical protein
MFALKHISAMKRIYQTLPGGGEGEEWNNFTSASTRWCA